MKKAISLFLALIMAMSCMSMSAFAEGETDTDTSTNYVAQIGENKYETLMKAIQAASSGDTIEILAGTWDADAIGTLSTPQAGSVRDKSLTIKAAEGATVTFTSNVSLGYDDSKTANATMTVKGLNFKNAKLSLVNYVRATVENCNFSGSGANAALYIGDSCDKNHLNAGDYPTAQVEVKGCTIDGTAAGSPGIRLRNVGGTVTLENNTVKNATHNGILIEANTSFNAVATNISITGNKVTEWNAGNATGGGRGMRLALGTLAEGSSVTITGNYFTKKQLGLDKPDFVKITEAGAASVDLSGNSWNNNKLDAVKNNGDFYTVDATATLETVIYNVAQIGDDKYETLQEAIDAASSGDTIKLLADVANGGGVKVSGTRTIVIDLNGHTYTVDNTAVGSTGTQTQGFQLLMGNNVTIKNGKINLSKDARKNGIQILFNVYCDFTLDDVDVDVTGCDDFRETSSIRFNNGKITITNGTTVKASDGVNAISMFWWPSGGYTDGAQLTIDSNVNLECGIRFGCYDAPYAPTGDYATAAGWKNTVTLDGTVSKIELTGMDDVAEAAAVLAKAIKSKSNTVGAPEGYEWTGPSGVYYTLAAAAETFAGYTDKELLDEQLNDVDDDVVTTIDPKSDQGADNTAYAAEKSGNSVTTYEVTVADETPVVANAIAATANVSDINTSSVIGKAKNANATSSGANNTIELFVKAEPTGSETKSVSYQVDPYAIVNGNTGSPVELSNADLNTTATGYQGFTFPVDAPAGVENGSYVKATHTWTVDDKHDTAGSENLGTYEVVDGKVNVTMKTFSTLTLTETVAPGSEQATIVNMNGYFADYFVLSLFVRTDVENPTFEFTRTLSNSTITLEQVTTRDAFCSANKAVYYVEEVNAGSTNTLNIPNNCGENALMVSIKFFTRFLDKDVTMTMKDGDEAIYVKGYGAYGFGSTDVALTHSYSFTDYTGVMAAWKGTSSAYYQLDNGLRSAAAGGWMLNSSN